MVRISRLFDEGKSTKKSFKNLRYGPRKSVSKHLNDMLKSPNQKFGLEYSQEVSYAEMCGRLMAGLYRIALCDVITF